VTIPENILFRELESEAVILNIDSESYLGLDDVGTRMWSALTASASIQEAYEVLRKEYDVDSATLRRDLTDLLEKLIANGLLRVINAPSP